MITSSSIAGQYEPKKWMTWLALSIAILLGMAAAAVARTPEPNRLPPEIQQFAKPMSPSSPATQLDEPENGLADTSEQLWKILKDHQIGRFAEARQGWDQIRLPQETRVWRDIALGALYLRAGELKQADFYLNAARQTQAKHAVLCYYTGLLRLEQANAAIRRLDDPTDARFFLASTVVPNRSVRQLAYELMAMAEFRNAIARASDIHLDEPLLKASDNTLDLMLVPSVGDLLIALGSDNFVSTSHDLLFALEIKRGMLAEAEKHLDQAVARGVCPLPWYEDLVRAYVFENQDQDAFRIMRKYLHNNFSSLMWFTTR
jgi:hypothetical protein